jgi:hypothetical protein
MASSRIHRAVSVKSNPGFYTNRQAAIPPAGTDLAARARTLDFIFGEYDIVSWTRGSRRQDSAIPMRGLVCSLQIVGFGAEDPDLGAMLALGRHATSARTPHLIAARYELGVIPSLGRPI